MRPSVSVEGIGTLDQALGMVALDGFELSPPKVRTRLVEVPGRSGSLDLTDALGGPLYEDRYQTLRFLIEGDPEVVKGNAVSALHGQRLRYSLSVDPGHTYVGRWSVVQSEEYFTDGACVLTCEIICDPWRYRAERTYRLNPAGGLWYSFESADMPVRPIIDCMTPTWVQDSSGRVSWLPAGSWRLNDVLFTRGVNRLYLNSWTLHTTAWGYIGTSGQHPLTWGDAHKMTWGELAQLSSSEGMAPRRWADLFGMTWADISDKTWSELRYRPSDGTSELPVDTTVYIRYEVGDL